MSTSPLRRTNVRRLGVGALSSAVVTGMLLVANPTAANAASVTVNPGDLRDSESAATYANWHQGYANGGLNAAITSGGLSLRGESQIIKGYADNDNADLATNGVNANVSALVGTTYNVTSGSAYFQLPLFVDTDNNDATAGDFTTLRPAVAHTGNAAIAATDSWISSKALGAIAANTPTPLSDIIAAVNAHKSKTLAFGVLTEAGSAATVHDITWNGDSYSFAAAPVTSTTVTDADVQPEETSSNYAEWHQGYGNATARQQVGPNGLVLAGQSQVIKGYSNNSDTLNAVNANLQFVLPEASYTVAAGSDPVFLQVPVKFNDGSGLKFTTLRNNGAAAGTHGVALTDSWQSSKALDGIPANTDASLSDIIAALGNYKTIGVGFLTNPGTVGTVSALTFGTRSYTFADTPAAGTPSVVKVSDIAPDESTYAGWHQGSATGHATATTDSNVLDLGTTKSQVIKGYANNSNTLDGRNVNLTDALTSASYSVTSGSVYFQVPLFIEDPVSGATVFTTLRPAAAAATGLNRVDVGQQWVSSKAIGTLPANTPALLGDILSSIKTYKVLAFGVFSDDAGNGKVTDITWDGVKYTFTGNRSPVTGNQSKSTTAGHAVAATLKGTDADGDAVVFSAPTSVTGGKVKVTGATLTFTPNSGYVGTTSVTYTATDTHGAARTGVVKVKVTKVATSLGLSSSTGAAKNTFIRVTPKAAGGIVNGATVQIKRNGNVVASGTVANGFVRLKVASKLKKGSYTFGVYYLGSTTTGARSAAYTVKITK
ncbi:MAG: Ig-like domain-containing protein [Marmoricola sp.]